MIFEGGRRKAVALALLAVLAGIAWRFMDAGNVRTVVLILLGGFALRVLLTSARPRYDSEESPE